MARQSWSKSAHRVDWGRVKLEDRDGGGRPGEPRTGPLMLAGVLPDGSVAFSDSSAYAIKIARPGASVWRILKRPLQPIRVTDRVIEAERDRRAARAAVGLGPGTPPLRTPEDRRSGGVREQGRRPPSLRGGASRWVSGARSWLPSA